MERKIHTDDAVVIAMCAAELELTTLLQKLDLIPLDSLENVKSRQIVTSRAANISYLLDIMGRFIKEKL
jgi:hypothetical protein